MDAVPAYLLAHFLKIRKHAGERGYLISRVREKDLQTSLDELSMARELQELHLIALSDQEDEIVFNPLVEEIRPGLTAKYVGTEQRVSFPRTFVVLARGRYIWTEILSSCTLWIASSVIGAVIGAVATLVLAGD